MEYEFQKLGLKKLCNFRSPTLESRDHHGDVVQAGLSEDESPCREPSEASQPAAGSGSSHVGEAI